MDQSGGQDVDQTVSKNLNQAVEEYMDEAAGQDVPTCW
jgi:hypothetical protein